MGSHATFDFRECFSGAAYAIAKRANQLRVQAAAVSWGDRGARVNSISPGIILTPLARDEMNGPDGAFITGSDLLIDGGVIAAIRAGRIQLSL